MEVTIFDKILSGEMNAEVVFENEFVLAFKDINPQAPVHVLVIPKQKFRDMSSSQHNEVVMGHFWDGIVATAHALHLEKDGYRVVINNGKYAMQTVDYLHAHILGGRLLGWPPG